jgi:methanogenesis imperfect marker protein 11
MELAKKGYQYLDHVTVQLYPHNPHKTQNCVAIALVFAIKPGEREHLVMEACQLLKSYTLSDKTAMAVLSGIEVPKKLRNYSEATKKSMITVEQAEKVAKETGVELVEVTGKQGKIGALAALGLYNDLKEAARVYE